LSPDDAAKVADELAGIQIPVELAVFFHRHHHGVPHFGEVGERESLVEYEVAR
jgi:hypothetical protein